MPLRNSLVNNLSRNKKICREIELPLVNFLNNIGYSQYPISNFEVKEFKIELPQELRGDAPQEESIVLPSFFNYPYLKNSYNISEEKFKTLNPYLFNYEGETNHELTTINDQFNILKNLSNDNLEESNYYSKEEFLEWKMRMGNYSGLLIHQIEAIEESITVNPDMISKWYLDAYKNLTETYFLVAHSPFSIQLKQEDPYFQNYLSNILSDSRKILLSLAVNKENISETDKENLLVGIKTLEEKDYNKLPGWRIIKFKENDNQEEYKNIIIWENTSDQESFSNEKDSWKCPNKIYHFITLDSDENFNIVKEKIIENYSNQLENNNEILLWEHYNFSSDAIIKSINYIMKCDQEAQELVQKVEELSFNPEEILESSVVESDVEEEKLSQRIIYDESEEPIAGPSYQTDSEMTYWSSAESLFSTEPVNLTEKATYHDSNKFPEPIKRFVDTLESNPWQDESSEEEEGIQERAW